MIDTSNKTLFLKSCTGTDVDRWGVLGLPHQRAVVALRRYNPGDLVLVAQSGDAIGENGPGGRGGRIFAVCTLSGRHGRTRDLASPSATAAWAADLDRWPECVAIDRYWRLRNPRHFREFGSNCLTIRCGQLRGKLHPVELSETLDAELREWLETAQVDELTVWRPRPSLIA